MSAWLDPVRAALDEAAQPVTVFFRDDDGGWSDDRLLALIARFARAGAPLDVAMIPHATTPSLAAALCRHMDAGQLLGVHQHGLRHVNHETEGRKCEFGPARPAAEQRADIHEGRELLRRLFDARLDDIFTPPWNRCTIATAEALVELGFGVLSREDRAERFGLGALRELPVAVDWCKRREGGGFDAVWVAGRVAASLRLADKPAGIMLHHAVMDEAEQDAVSELLALMAVHRNARFARMRDCAPAARAPACMR